MMFSKSINNRVNNRDFNYDNIIVIMNFAIIEQPYVK